MEVLANETSLTSPHFIEVSLQSQKSDRFFMCVRRLFLRLSYWICNVIYIHEGYFVRGFVCKETPYWSWWIDWCFASLNFNSHRRRQPNSISPFGKGIYVLSSTFRPLSAKLIECIHNNFRVMFSIYGLNLTIFWSFDYISHKDRLLKIFSSSVIMWPAGFYMNGELTQVQSIEFDNVVILQYVLVVGDLGCSVWDYRNRLNFWNMGNFRFEFCCWSWKSHWYSSRFSSCISHSWSSFHLPLLELLYTSRLTIWINHTPLDT